MLERGQAVFYPGDLSVSVPKEEKKRNQGGAALIIQTLAGELAAI